MKNIEREIEFKKKKMNEKENEGQTRVSPYTILRVKVFHVERR